MIEASAHVVVDGATVPLRYSTLAEEVGALRGAVGISRQPHVAVVRLAGDGAWNALDRIAASDLFLRDVQLRQSLLLHEDGRILADVHVGADGDGFLVLSEGLPAPALIDHVRAHAGGERVEVEDLGASHALLSVGGPFAWELLAALEGPGVVGLPYLSFYRPARGTICFRAGKTGEYGYDLLVPRSEADEPWATLAALGSPLGARPVGLEALDHAAFENWFFCLRHHELSPLTPVELGLRWRLSRRKDFIGRAALDARRARPAQARCTAIRSSDALAAGDLVVCGDRTIGTVLRATSSATLGETIGAALLDATLAHPGIDAVARDPGGSAPDRPLCTVSAPFVNNLSLYLDPQRHSYATRAELAYPGPRRPRYAPPRG